MGVHDMEELASFNGKLSSQELGVCLSVFFCFFIQLSGLSFRQEARQVSLP